MNAKTYRQVTLEFLALSRRNVVEIDGKEVVEFLFQISNNQHSMTADAINEFFSILMDRSLLTNPINECAKVYGDHSWWCALTGEPGRFSSASSKFFWFQHPTIRYVARLILYSLFSKKSAGALSSTELRALWLAAAEIKALWILETS